MANPNPRLNSQDEALLQEALAFAYGEPDQLESVDAPPPPPSSTTPTQPKENSWYPDLNPTQRLIFEDPTLHILGYGEKGSGKSIGFGHKIVRHAYENDNALVLIITPSIRTGNLGIWFDLETLILPQWREGMGLEYTASKLDPITKDRHRWVRNRFGGWSQMLLMSIPFGTQVAARVKGPAPSCVYIDEVTNCDSPAYFTYIAAQLGRRRGIDGPQQFLASCNPEGPSHWVYERFWVLCMDENGKRKPGYAVYHVPIAENKHRLPEGYVDRLEENLKSDPIELRRLVFGEWIDRPSGEGIFKEFFVPAIHVKGDAKKGEGLVPLAGFPIIIGYDLGQMWNCATFMQCIPTKETDKPTVWIIFDEVDHLQERIIYKRMAWEIIDRIKHWRKLADYPFQVMHITDESALNQWHPGGEGSFDAWDFEREYEKVASGLSEKSAKMIGCGIKGPGSVSARIRAMQGKLFQEEIYISALCKNTLDMLMYLEADEKDPEKPKRGKHVHKFDSATYPILKLELRGAKNFLPTARSAPTLIRCGSDTLS
jgi:hypothetical protein